MEPKPPCPSEAAAQEQCSVELKATTLKYSSLVYLRNGRTVIWDCELTPRETLHNPSLEIEYTPDYVRKSELFLGIMEAGKTCHVRHTGFPDFSEERLLAVKDEEPGKVCITLRGEDGSVITQKEIEFTWLAHNAWAGGYEFPELLAALVIPEDSAIDKLLEDTKTHLASQGRSTEWAGYSGSAEERVSQLKALWDTLASYDIHYALPPASWKDDGVGQRVRTPSQIFEGKCATCLDTSLLLTAAVTRMRLNPIVILIEGHAFMGVWMNRKALPHPKDAYPATVRNFLKQGEILLLETTSVTGDRGNAPAAFETAAKTATEEMAALADDAFFLALDIRMLWHECSILPIQGGTGSDYDASHETEELITSQPKNRIDNWQLKLLDLSLRNNMLNCKPDGRRQLQLLLPDVGDLEDELAKGTSFRIQPVPETLWTVITSYNKGKGSTYDRERIESCVQSMYAKHELTANINEKNLQRSLQAIYSTTRREMEESGSNTLYLACGFLKWYRSKLLDKAYYAPILLIPVVLTRPSVRAGFVLRGNDEETRVNLTLLEYLKTEYQIHIPELEGELPTDAHGLDVPFILNCVRKAISTMPGWEVEDMCTLGSFSFTKHLMWKDLVERRGTLMQNAIVKQIAAEERSSFPQQEDFPNPANLDNDVDAGKVYTPMSSDSSQLSAIIAAGRGKSFVLIGPPGTGKSQTITNMIAHCLGHGKTVLFVAEKSAALQVVHSRLKRIGLEDFCLELHSHKANKKDALAQFKKSVDLLSKRKNGSDYWGESVYSMAQTRYKLNLLPWEMHRSYPDGGSLYRDLCLIAENDGLQIHPLVDDDPMTMSRERLHEIVSTARELSNIFHLVETIPASVLSAISATEYTEAWDKNLVEALRLFSELSRSLANSATELVDALKGTVLREHLLVLLPVLTTWHEQPQKANAALFPSKAAATLSTVSAVREKAERCRELRAKLTLAYPDTTTDEPDLDIWLRKCKELTISNSVSRWLGMRKVSRFLKGQALSSKTPDCLADLTNLVALREAKRLLKDINTANLPEYLQKGEALTHDDFVSAEKEAQTLSFLTNEDEDVLKQIIARPELIPTASNVTGKAIAAIAAAKQQMRDIQKSISNLLGQPIGGYDDALNKEGSQWAEPILDCRTRWREICIWNKAVKNAEEKKCRVIADKLASHTIAPGDIEKSIDISLADKRVRAVSDKSDVLSDFAPSLHEDRIKDYANKDTKLMEMTSEHIRSILVQRASRVVDYGTETSLLHRELAKQRAHMPLRQLLSSLPNITPLLKPCLLMSPLSVAQYLSTDAAPFDVVIFDEASQIPVWDAIGVIARGKNAIIVGDPKQMPPTSFFSRSKVEETDEFVETDMESILDECRACGVPEMYLTWHYRSKSESLIAFSNKKYYENELVTFPAPVTEDSAVSYHYVAQGTYEPGAGKRINREEAKQLVQHVLNTLRDKDFRYTEATSIGIVTFNMQQQELIESMLLEERANDESLEPYFAEDNPEAIFVKNLENVQGDERGIIYFSTTYGPDESGKISMNFGPLNLSGGERRLNVAITRARNALHVFTSLFPEDIDLSRTGARGAADFHDFLAYAKRGIRNETWLQNATPRHEELAVNLARALEKSGWKCQIAVGISSYRIDISVEHPDIPNATIAGIMLDGESYASSHTARDRDILRPSVLTGLGWRLIHVWAIDWWRHPDVVLAKLEQTLEEYRAMGPPTPPELPELIQCSKEPDENVREKRPQREEKPDILHGKTYAAYSRKDFLPPLFEMSDASLAIVLKDFVSVEGPAMEPYIIRRIANMSVMPRLSDSVKFHISEIISNLIANGDFESSAEPYADTGTDCRIITAIGQLKVLPREKGPRDWAEIPLSEYLAIATEIREVNHYLVGSGEHVRAIGQYIGLARQSKQFKQFIANLLSSNATMV